MLLSAVLTMVISSCTTPRPRLVAASASAVARRERDDVLSVQACSGRLVLSEVVCIDHTQLPVRISQLGKARFAIIIRYQSNIPSRGDDIFRLSRHLLSLGLSASRQPMSGDRTSLVETLLSWAKYSCLALRPRRGRRNTWTRDPKSPKSRHSSTIRRAP